MRIHVVMRFFTLSNHTGQIENPDQEMALRLSSHLLVGLSKIYTRKVQFLFTDCNEALSKITLVSARLRHSSLQYHPYLMCCYLYLSLT